MLWEPCSVCGEMYPSTELGWDVTTGASMCVDCGGLDLLFW